MNFLDTCRGLHAQDGRYLVRVGFDASLSDQVSKKLFGGHFESIFLEVKPDLIFPKAIKCLSQVLQVVIVLEAFHKHLIDIHLYQMSDLLLEDFVDHPLEVATTFFSPKGIIL